MRRVGITERYAEPLGSDLTIFVASVWENGAERTVYEVKCSHCGAVDSFGQRDAAETYGPQHTCLCPNDGGAVRSVDGGRRCETCGWPTISAEWPSPLCPLDSTVLRWEHDQWFCPKCRNEWHEEVA